MRTSIKQFRIFPSPTIRRVELGAGENVTSIEIFCSGRPINTFEPFVRSHPEGGFFRSEPVVLASGVTSIVPNPGGLDLTPNGPLPEGASSGGIIAGGSADAVMVGLPGNGITRAFVIWETKGIYSVGFEATCTGDATDSTHYSDLIILVSLG